MNGHQTSLLGLTLLLTCAVLTACEEGPPPAHSPVGESPLAENLELNGLASPTDYDSVVRGPESIRRLTREQFESAVKGLLGAHVVVPKIAEPDVIRSGLKSIGASAITYTPRGVETLESASFDVASQAMADEETRSRIVPCTPTGAEDEACAASTLRPLASRAWRRPVTDEEVTVLVALATGAGRVLDDFYQGLEYGIAGIIQSPYFLFRVELGDNPSTEGARALTDYELASRLSFFLWNEPPDDTLWTAASDGELSTDEGLFQQAKRLLDDPKARDGMRALFIDYLQLYELDHLSKDPTVFEHFNDQLGRFAQEETLRMVEDLVFDMPRDFRDIMTSRETFINPMLASIYQVPAPNPNDFGRARLPASMGRAGLLGQVSFLAVHAHSRASSATRRGVAVRNILLCQPIPAAPVDVDTSIPEPSSEVQTLRDRVAKHLESPSCAGCHQLTDPIGLGLENFDGLGRYREREYGTVIDPAGELDGMPFDDAVSLGHRIREHQEFVPCVVKMLSRYATGRLESLGEDEWLQVLNARFEYHGYRLRPLILELIMSPIFRTVGPLKEAE